MSRKNSFEGNIQEEDGLKKEAGELLKEQEKQSFVERTFSPYQTRKTKLPGTEKTRGETFRWERGQIYKAYMNLRSEIQAAEKAGENTLSKKELLKEIRLRAKGMEKDLDELNRQLYENVKEIEIETDLGKFTVPVVELDLGRDKDGNDSNKEHDTRTPDFYLGSVATQAHQNAALLLARALRGHKVYVPTQLEQPSVKKPDNFKETLAARGDLTPYSEVAKKIIEHIGLEKFNIVGFSSGSAQALELARDPELKGLNDLIVIEPLGVEDKGLLRLGNQFVFRQGGKTFSSTEEFIKTMKQGGEEGQGDMKLLFETGKILAKQHFDAEKLSQIKLEGRFQIVRGAKSPIVSKKVFDGFKEIPNVELFEVEDATHAVGMTHSLGWMGVIDKERSATKLTKIGKSDSTHSVMEWMLKDIKG